MFSGVVVHAEKIARTLGYPTANLDLKPADIGLADGVYTAYSLLKGKTYASVLVVVDRVPLVEIHLLDYSGPEFYGDQLSVDPREKISEIATLDGIAMKAKIEDDIARAKAWFTEKKM